MNLARINKGASNLRSRPHDKLFSMKKEEVNGVEFNN
jgi:hypothetical protein